MLRFCDENAGHISFVFGLDVHDKLVMGSIGGETIKDFKQVGTFICIRNMSSGNLWRLPIVGYTTRDLV